MGLEMVLFYNVSKMVYTNSVGRIEFSSFCSSSAKAFNKMFRFNIKPLFAHGIKVQHGFVPGVEWEAAHLNGLRHDFL